MKPDTNTAPPGLEDALSGRMAGWPLAPLLIWLLTEGRDIAEPAPLIDALAQRLLDAGAPLWRLRIGMRAIHPFIAGSSVIWQRDDRKPAEEIGIGYQVLESDAYHGSPIEQYHQSGKMIRHRLDNLDPDRDHALLFELAEQGARDYLLLPMIDSDVARHLLIVVTDRDGGFTDLDIAKFSLLAQVLSQRFEIIAGQRLARTLMDTYLGHRTGQKVLKGLIRRGDGEVINLALWYSDLRDFTRMTDTLPPAQLFDLLNSYFELVSAAVTARGGEILSFIGDAMLVMFSCEAGTAPDETAPAGESRQSRSPAGGIEDGGIEAGGIENSGCETHGEPAACQAAIDSAVDAFERLAELNAARRRDGQPEIHFGVGLDVGRVIYGNVGTPERLEFTVIGSTVNRTARLEALTKTALIRNSVPGSDPARSDPADSDPAGTGALKGDATGAVERPILMSARFARQIAQPVTIVGHFEMKGFAGPQEVFSLARE
jgi:adenylate cyclase